MLDECPGNDTKFAELAALICTKIPERWEISCRGKLVVVLGNVGKTNFGSKYPPNKNAVC